jgi:hypothetical protein
LRNTCYLGCYVLCIFQRDTLDEQFDELFAGISEKLQADIDLELANEGHEGELSGDDDIIVAEYVSDDEISMSRVTAVESDIDDKSNDDISKVRIMFITNINLHPGILFA